MEIISRVLRKNLVESVPLLSWRPLSRPVDFDTVERTARSQELDKAPGAGGNCTSMVCNPFWCYYGERLMPISEEKNHLSALTNGLEQLQVVSQNN